METSAEERSKERVRRHRKAEEKDPRYQNQRDLETLFSKYQLLPVLKDEFRTLAEQHPDEDLHEFITDALTHLSLHRQADASTLVGILSPKWGTPQEVADQLLILAELDYMDVEEKQYRDYKTGKITKDWVFSVRFDVSNDIHEMLDKYQFPLPMVVHPKKVRKNFDTGYLTILNPVVLNGSEYFDDVDVCLDHLNRMNHVALELNMEVVNSNEGRFVSPTREPDEDFKDFQKRQKQAAKFYETTVDVMETIVQFGNEFYLTHRYDRRGRCYASGYHINTQGDDYRKAMIVLSRKETLNHD